MSGCDLDLWPLDLELLQHFRCHCLNSYKIGAKSNNPRLTYWRLSTFSRAILGVGTFTGRFSRVRGPNFIKLGDDIAISSLLEKFVSEFSYLAAFSYAGGSKLSDVENDAKFRTFWPHVKISGRVGEISGSINEALPTNEPLKYIWWPSYALKTCSSSAESEWCIDKKRKKERKFISVY